MMRPRWIRSSLVALAAFAMGLAPSAAGAVTCDGALHRVPAPSPGLSTALGDVSASSATEAWSVGLRLTQSQDEGAFGLHWDGTTWTRIKMVAPKRSESLGVTDLSPTDAWAVGNRLGPSGGGLIEHWDGLSWSKSAIVVPGAPQGASLRAIDAVSANDIWAVGFFYDATAYHAHTLAVHYDGKSWSVVSTPDASATSNTQTLEDVDAVSSSDVWAAGRYLNPSSGELRTLIEHWNGTAWSIVPSPNPSSNENARLDGIVGVAANDAWAVGSQTVGFSQPSLIERWNGTTWSIVTSPNPGLKENILSDVVALSSTDVWASGARSDVSPPVGTSLVIRWNGSSWSVAAAPSPGTQSAFSGLAAVPGGTLFGAGSWRNSRSNEQVLVAEACGA